MAVVPSAEPVALSATAVGLMETAGVASPAEEMREVVGLAGAAVAGVRAGEVVVQRAGAAKGEAR